MQSVHLKYEFFLGLVLKSWNNWKVGTTGIICNKRNYRNDRCTNILVVRGTLRLALKK
jgi:hypothetical protein